MNKDTQTGADLPPCKIMFSSGLTLEELSEKYQVSVKVLKKRLYAYKYRTGEAPYREIGKLKSMIYDRGYTIASLAREIGYTQSAVVVAVRKGLSLHMLRAFIKPLKLTDEEVTKIVKGEIQ